MAKIKHLMQHTVHRVPLYPGVLRDLQRHLVNAAAIWAAIGSVIERCFTDSP